MFDLIGLCRIKYVSDKGPNCTISSSSSLPHLVRYNFIYTACTFTVTVYVFACLNVGPPINNFRTNGRI